MNRLMISLALIFALFSCQTKTRKKDDSSTFFSVLSYVQAQAKNIDTSLYRIIKIEKRDSISDTVDISREDFRKYASDFLSLPDITEDDRKEHYEESTDYDEMMQMAFMTYTATHPDEVIRRETVMTEPDPVGVSKVKTIIINTLQTGKDSTVEKDMTWHEHHFQVSTKIRKPGQDEKIKLLIVKWE